MVRGAQVCFDADSVRSGDVAPIRFVSLVVSIGIMILFANCKPYVSKSDDILAQFCQLSSTFAMAVGILEMASESSQVCIFV